jgi:DNA-binding transcriptional LysR family regulator
MDRLDAMSILVRVAETASFSAASRQLGVPLATVSRKVADLEAHLGTRLLIRTTRKVTLTDAGAIYVAAVKRILEEVDENERVVAGEFQQPRGELILTAPVLFGRLHILPVVTAFLQRFADIRVRLVLSDRNLDLIDDHVDVALRIGPLPDSRMVARRIGSMRTVVCASPRLLADFGTPADPPSLTAIPCVNFDILSAAPTWTFRSKHGKAATHVSIAPRLSVSTAEAAVWAAAQGVGVTQVLHYQCAPALRDGSLRIILAEFEPAPLPVHLLHAGGGTVASKTRAFLDFAADRLKGTLTSR